VVGVAIVEAPELDDHEYVKLPEPFTTEDKAIVPSATFQAVE
jgi:hypothetical protein